MPSHVISKPLPLAFLVALCVVGPATTLSAQATPAPTTFYVDAVNGSDSADGTTENSAWQTLSRIRRQVLTPGDRVLLRRGGDWATGREQLLIANDSSFNVDAFDPANPTINAPPAPAKYGSAEHPIEINAYGEGENPKVFWLGIHRIPHLTMRNIAVTARVAGTEYPAKVHNNRNILIEDCTITGMLTMDSHNVVLRRVGFCDNAIEHGLYLNHGSRAFLIEDCLFARNKTHGIQTNGANMDNILDRRCRLWDNGKAQYNNPNSHNVTFANNLFFSRDTLNGVNAMGIQDLDSENRFFNNVFICVATIAAQNNKVVPACSVRSMMTLKNNVYFVLRHAFEGGDATTVSDHNAYYAIENPEHLVTYSWGQNFATGWVQRTGNDTHSLFVDPGFVDLDLSKDPDQWDLHLKPTSPLINAGVDVGLPYLGSAPDIGMYEYGEPTPYQLWAGSFGLPTDGTGTAGPDADPDSDGLPNLAEYALGGDPTSGGDTIQPTATTTNDHLQISFRRWRAEVAYVVEVSSDLSTWTPVAYQPVPTGEVQLVVDPSEVAGTERRFMRLRFSLP